MAIVRAGGAAVGSVRAKARAVTAGRGSEVGSAASLTVGRVRRVTRFTRFTASILILSQNLTPHPQVLDSRRRRGQAGMVIPVAEGMGMSTVWQDSAMRSDSDWECGRAYWCGCFCGVFLRVSSAFLCTFGGSLSMGL